MAPEACFEKERHPVLGGLKFKFSRYFYLIYCWFCLTWNYTTRSFIC